MTNADLKIENLSVCYGADQVVSAANLEATSGTMTALIGPNGAGKSTLLRAALGLIPRKSGSVTVGGHALNGKRKEVAYVPQRGDVDWNFPITVEQTALLGTYPRLGLLRRPTQRSRQLAHAALQQVELLDLKNRSIDQLSGGQQQRMFLARALAQEPRLILLDEPFTAVDAKSEKVIVGVLNELKASGAALLVVHHNLATLAEYFDRVIVLNNTVRASGKPAEILVGPDLASAYNLPMITEPRNGGPR
ncbi:MAG TPA: metal ABC transporter ATP-binding protein [Actinomycetales bacterium]|nr:metal ABC transporter ATP-binding protein [Actinomycetales bacterium]